MSFQRISVAQAKAMIDAENVTLLDIRDQQSYLAGHVNNAIHLTNENLEGVVDDADKEKPVIIYCYHGNSSQGAADYFFNLGFKQAYSVDGGYEIWKLSA